MNKYIYVFDYGIDVGIHKYSIDVLKEIEDICDESDDESTRIEIWIAEKSDHNLSEVHYMTTKKELEIVYHEC